MSYIQQNVTQIDLLPELEDLEKSGPYDIPPGGILPRPGFQPQQHYNENPYQPSNNGSAYATYPGMSMIPPKEAERIGRLIRNNHTIPSEAGMNPYISQSPEMYAQPSNSIEKYGDPIDAPKSFDLPPNTPSCLNVAEHISNCPICSKFYNNDKTIYIIAIIVLALVCILLLKRVLDV